MRGHREDNKEKKQDTYAIPLAVGQQHVLRGGTFGEVSKCHPDKRTSLLRPASPLRKVAGDRALVVVHGTAK